MLDILLLLDRIVSLCLGHHPSLIFTLFLQASPSHPYPHSLCITQLLKPDASWAFLFRLVMFLLFLACIFYVLTLQCWAVHWIILNCFILTKTYFLLSVIHVPPAISSVCWEEVKRLNLIVLEPKCRVEFLLNSWLKQEWGNFINTINLNVD